MLEFRTTLYAERAGPKECVLVLGPYFTGSASSLRMAIHNWATALPANDDTFAIISGSATGIDKFAFSGLVKKHGHDPLVEFGTTVHNEMALFHQMIIYINSINMLSPTPGKIAVLAPPETVLEQKIETIISKLTDTPIVFLPLPLHLSQAESAFGLRDLNRILAGIQSSENSRKVLLPLAVDSETRDSVPLLSASPDVTPQGELLLLAKSLATISREDIRYVGILLSNAAREDLSHATYRAILPRRPGVLLQ